MIPDKVSEDKSYKFLFPFIGKVVSVDDFGDGVVTGVLSVFKSDKGKEGWQIGNFPQSPCMIFAVDLIRTIEIKPRNDTCMIWLGDDDQ